MSRCLLVILLTFLLLHSRGQSYGLRFLSHDVVQEERTSLLLTPEAPFRLKSSYSLSFDLQFVPNMQAYTGYVLRIITNKEQSIDIVYNQRKEQFNLVVGEEIIGIVPANISTLSNSWSKFTIQFDSPNRQVSFYWNEKIIASGQALLDKNTSCQFYFGRCDLTGFQTSDIPPMKIKDITISSKAKILHRFPLNEIQGNTCRDIVKGAFAEVRNPMWIRALHGKWASVLSFDTKSAASVAFNKDNEELFIVSQDTLYTFSFKTMDLKPIRLSVPHDSMLAGNQSIYSTFTKSLYNFYIDQKVVSTFDNLSARWNKGFGPGPLGEFWQANKFVSAIDTSLYIFGGYGQLQYKNVILKCHLPTEKWETVSYSGHEYSPRYLAALGSSIRNDTVYILGGYGSKTGDQTLNPKHNYELLAFSIKNHSFEKLFELKPLGYQFCFSNSMVVDSGTNSYYTLTYPEDRYQSQLRLIKGSLGSPNFNFMGDSIPYHFNAVESYSDLFYAPYSKKLIAVTLYLSDYDHTSVNVYTLDFPPDILDDHTPNKSISDRWFYIPLIIIVVGALSYAIFKRYKNEPLVVKEQEAEKNIEERQIALVQEKNEATTTILSAIQVSTIKLFGDFEVLDKNGRNITRLFSPLLKELFFLLLLNSHKGEKGISPDKIYETLWADKPAKDAKNNFSVNLVKLKNLLENVGEFQLIKEDGKWKLEVLDETVNIDYIMHGSLLSRENPKTKDLIIQLQSIARRGQFLSGLHYNWVDDKKSAITWSVIDTFIEYISKSKLSDTDPELVIQLSNTMLMFDNLNEEGLRFKCQSLTILGRHGLAKEAWLKFEREYFKSYGEAPNFEFKDIISI